MFQQYTIIKNFLTEDECSSILNYSLKKSNLNKAVVSTDDKDEINETIRKSKVAFNNYINEFPFLKNKLENAVSNIFNLKGFDINLENDIFQFTEYNIGEFYNWHQDANEKYKLGNRYCSIVILLNEDYEGGVLEIKDTYNSIIELDKNIGNLFIFTSKSKHRVTMVTKGIRHSLVNWFSLKEKLNHKKTII